MIERSNSGPTAILTMNRPPVNAMNIEFLKALTIEIDAAAQNTNISAIVLTGSGNSFSAGVDLKLAARFTKEDQNKMLMALNLAFTTVYACPLPIVAAINGHAIAGGLVLALACDYRIAASHDFEMSLAEVHVGVPYPIAAIEIVKSELSAPVARRLVLLGQELNSKGCESSGVVDELSPGPKLLARATDLARSFASHPKTSYGTIKHQFRKKSLHLIGEALDGAEPLYDGWFGEEMKVAVSNLLNRRTDASSKDR